MVQLLNTYSAFGLSTVTIVLLTVIPCFCLIPTQRRWINIDEIPEINVDELNDQRSILLLPQEKIQEFQQQQELPRRLPFFSTFNLSPDERPKRAPRICGIRILKKLDAVCNKCSKRPETEPVPFKRSGSPVEKGDKVAMAHRCCIHGCDDEELQAFCC